MAKKNDPNNFKFPTNVRSDSFIDFLASSHKTEQLLTIVKNQIHQEIAPVPDVVLSTDNVSSTTTDSKETSAYEANRINRSEIFLDSPGVAVNNTSSSFNNLGEYAQAILNDPSAQSGNFTRFRMADESHLTLKVIRQALVERGIMITMPRLLDFIIQGHGNTMGHLFKSLKKRGHKSIK